MPLQKPSLLFNGFLMDLTGSSTNIFVIPVKEKSDNFRRQQFVDSFLSNYHLSVMGNIKLY